MKDQEALEWASRLTSALKRWCKDKSYVSFHKLADDLGLVTTGSPWRAISSGRNIVEKIDPTLYARIFLWTELTEADPRKIPPRKFKGVGESAKDRAWTANRYQSWLRSNEAKALLAKKAQKFPIFDEEVGLKLTEREGEVGTTQMPPGGFNPSLGSFFGIQIDTLVSLLADQLWQRFKPEIKTLLDQQFAGIQQNLLAEVLENRESKTNDVGKLTQALLEALQPSVKGNRSDRERLLKRYGDLLKDLFVILDMFTANPEERERIVQTFQREGD